MCLQQHRQNDLLKSLKDWSLVMENFELSSTTQRQAIYYMGGHNVLQLLPVHCSVLLVDNLYVFTPSRVLGVFTGANEGAYYEIFCGYDINF